MQRGDTLPWATILVFLLGIIGGAEVIFGDELTFQEYMTIMAPSAALLGVGRGLAARNNR